MDISVRFFGQLTEITGCSSISMPVVDDTDLLDHELKQRYPMLDGAKYAVAVNKKIIRQRTQLSEGTEVALLPPFSGG